MVSHHSIHQMKQLSVQRVKQYLTGIQSRNPDWSKEDVLRAYNWGPGNVHRHKSGKRKDMPKEAQEYPHKILKQLSKMRDHETYFNQGGLLGAEPPPLPEEEALAPPVPRGRMKGRGPQQGAWSPAMAGGVDNREVAQAQRDSLGEADDLWLSEAGQADVMHGRSDSINPNVEQVGEVPNVPGQDIPMGVLPGDEAVEAIKAETDTPEAVAEMEEIDTVPNEEQEKVGKEIADEDPSALDRVKDAFGNAFSNLLDDDKLAEAAIMYLGSRALGYSHAGSLRWTGKNYLAGIQEQKKAAAAAAAKHDERVFDLAKGDKFSPASVKAYEKTGDVSTLRPKTGGIKRTDSQPQTFFDKNGKEIKVWEYDGPNGKYLGNSAGAQIPDEAFGQLHQDAYKVPGTKAYNDRVKGNINIAKDQISSLREQFGTRGEVDDKTVYATDINPATQAGEIAKWAAKNDVNQEELAGLVESAYHDALNSDRQDGKRVRDLVPYLNQLVVRKQVGNPDIFRTADGNLVAADKLAVVNDVIKRQLPEGANTKHVADQYYNAMLNEWNALSGEEQAKYNARANDNENGFYVFIANDLKVDNRMNKK